LYLGRITLELPVGRHPCRIGSKLRDLVMLPYRSLIVDLTAPARSAARRIDFANI
jgi:hypothetical protein